MMPLLLTCQIRTRHLGPITADAYLIEILVKK